jgi:hypothetical protein
VISYEIIFEFLPIERVDIKKMFGHQCLYFDGRMVMFLISKEGNEDNGICVATSKDHIESLGRELKSLRYLKSYGPDATNWRLIPSDSDRFEVDVEKACQLILKNDPRIGREPKSRKKSLASQRSVRKKK